MSEANDMKPHEGETILLPSKIEHKGIVYQDRYKKIEKIQATFNTFNKEYFVADFGKKAAVIIVRNNNILFIKQYRLLINDISYEIPGGIINKGETPRDAAIRECLEEAGVKCRNLKPLVNFNPDLEYTKNYTHIFYTEDIADMPSDDSRYIWIPLRDCMDMIFTEKISDCLSIIAIFAYWIKVSRKEGFTGQAK